MLSPEKRDSRLLGTVIYIVAGYRVSIYLDCFYDIGDILGFSRDKMGPFLDREQCCGSLQWTTRREICGSQYHKLHLVHLMYVLQHCLANLSKAS
jgi:hypothetical protein